MRLQTSGTIFCIRTKANSKYLDRNNLLKFGDPKTKLFMKSLLPTRWRVGYGLGCMSASGVGNLVFITSTMNKLDYFNILKNNVAPSIYKLGLTGNGIFQQDNDPKHKSKIVSEWLLYRTPKI